MGRDGGSETEALLTAWRHTRKSSGVRTWEHIVLGHTGYVGRHSPALQQAEKENRQLKERVSAYTNRLRSTVCSTAWGMCHV